AGAAGYSTKTSTAPRAFLATILDVATFRQVIILHRQASSHVLPSSPPGLSWCAETVRFLEYKAPANFAQWSASLIKPFFTLVRHHACQSVVGPASPAASPEFRVLSHGCVASRGVLKGAPRSIRVPRECPYRRWRLRR